MRLNGENIIQLGFIVGIIFVWFLCHCLVSVDSDLKRHRVDSGYEGQDEVGEEIESDEDGEEAAVNVGAGLHEATADIMCQLYDISNTIIHTFSQLEMLSEESPQLTYEQSLLLENLAEIHARITKSIKYGLTMIQTAADIAKREAPENKYTYMKFKDDLAAGVYMGHEGKYVVVDEYKNFVKLVGTMGDAIAIISAPDSKGMGVYKIPGIAAPFSPVHEPSEPVAPEPSAEPQISTNMPSVSIEGINVEINADLLRAFRNIVGEVELLDSEHTVITTPIQSTEIDFEAMD